MYHFGIIYNESSILFTLGQNFLLVDLQEFYFRFRVGGGGGRGGRGENKSENDQPIRAFF